MYGLQASGGAGLLRFFISGRHERETGPFVMPDTEITRITAVRGTAPRATQIHPNQLRHYSYRGNFQVALAPNATIDINAAVSDRVIWQPFDGGLLGGFSFQFLTAPGCATRCSATLRSDGLSTNGTQREYVGDIFSVEEKTSTQRTTASASLDWAPMNWLQASLDGRPRSVETLLVPARAARRSAQSRSVVWSKRGARILGQGLRAQQRQQILGRRWARRPPSRSPAPSARGRRSARSGSRTRRTALAAKATVWVPASRLPIRRRSGQHRNSLSKTRRMARSSRST